MESLERAEELSREIERDSRRYPAELLGGGSDGADDHEL